MTDDGPATDSDPLPAPSGTDEPDVPWSEHRARRAGLPVTGSLLPV